MATVSDALSALGVTQWVLRGEPTNADEFGAMFRKVTGSDDNGSAIESDNASDWGVTWAQVQTKQSELTAAEPLAALRAERDRLIAATDWWASSDLNYHHHSPHHLWVYCCIRYLQVLKYYY